MTESAHNSIILKPANEERFNKIYSTFAKTQPNSMKFSQFIQFLLDRCMLTNKVTLTKFYELFTKSTEKRISKDPIPPNNAVIQKSIKRQQLIFLFNELGKLLYHNNKGYQDKIYNDLLGEKVMVNKQSMQYSRVMQMDEINRKIFQQSSVLVLCQFQKQLKNLYLIYIDENYWSMKNQSRILLTHREVQLQNKRMSAISFVRFLKQAEIIPHIINIEHVEEILSKVIPPTNGKENEFYYKHFLVDAYSKDIDNPKLKHEADPGLALFQFITALARIGIQTSRQVQNSKKAYDYIIPKFLKNYLNLRTDQEISQNVQISVGTNRIFLTKLIQYYNTNEDGYIQLEQNEQQQYHKTPFQIMRQKQRQMDKMSLQFNLDTIVAILQNQLPPMPPEIEVKQQLPPPYPAKFKQVQKITIGQQPPPQKVDKNKQMKPPQKKKQQLKKGQKPPRIFKYKQEKQQTKKILGSQNYFQQLATQLDYSLKPITSFERGSIPIDPYPLIITEILYPSEIPENIVPFIEAAINAHNEGRYSLALQNYGKAHEAWKQQLNTLELKPSLELFFEFTKGSVYQSAVKDDHAFNSFFICKGISQKLGIGNPDRALPYCGMGQVLYIAQEYQLSARCYLKARQIRQNLLGMENVDTATVFNNLGCCFFMEDRNKEALSYFKIALTIFMAQLGQFHQRTQTASQNQELCNKSFYKNTPQYRKLWQVFQKDVFGKKKKKKKKGSKK